MSTSTARPGLGPGPGTVGVQGLQAPFAGVHLRRDRPPIEPDAVERAVENEHDRRILAHVQADRASAGEIIEATDIAKSTVYRRLEQLEEEGLIEVAGGAMHEGHKVDLYAARVEMAALRVEAGAVDAEWRLMETPDERLFRLWDQLGGS